MKIEQFFNDNFAEQVEMLTDAEAGELLKGVMLYVRQGNAFKTDNRVLKIIFSAFKANYDRETKRSGEISEKRVNAGRMGGFKKADNRKQNLANCSKVWQNVANVANATKDVEYKEDSQNAQESKQNVANLANANGDADTQQLTLFDEPETKIVDDKIQDNNIINNNINNNNNNRDSIEVVGEKEEEKEEEEIKKKEEKKKEKALELARRQENLEKRKQEFYQSLIPFCDLYPREMLRDFYEYWSELNRSKTQMRYEQQKTWETSKRLAQWARRENSKPAYNNGNNRTISPDEAARQRAEEAARAIRTVITTPKRDYEAEEQYIRELFREGNKGA